MTANSISNSESFRLADNCLGVIWQDADGWHGCLKWDVEGNTDFVGPLLTSQSAIDEVKAAFLESESIK